MPWFGSEQLPVFGGRLVPHDVPGDCLESHNLVLEDWSDRGTPTVVGFLFVVGSSISTCNGTFGGFKVVGVVALIASGTGRVEEDEELNPRDA